MNDQIFRKKSLNRIKSPETLDDYIKVSNPGIWLLLISIIILLIGACVWGVFGHIDSVVTTTVRVQDGQAICYVSEGSITSIKEGLTVKFADCEATIQNIGEKTVDGYSCVLSGVSSLSNGFYDGKVVIKTYNPLSFIFN